MTAESSGVQDVMNEFAGAVAHELRTPLAAVFGEVEVALRRDRSAAEYRDALQRIATGVAELVAITGDLTLLSDPVALARDASLSACLTTVLSSVERWFAHSHIVRIDADAVAGLLVAGHQERLQRAATLVVEHAIRYRRGNAHVTVRGLADADGRRGIAIDAPSAGFWPHAWLALDEQSDAPAPLRLRIARCVIEAAGGRLRTVAGAESEAVHIDLRPFLQAR
jgi:signal transduction histidine kinase